MQIQRIMTLFSINGTGTSSLRYTPLLFAPSMTRETATNLVYTPPVATTMGRISLQTGSLFAHPSSVVLLFARSFVLPFWMEFFLLLLPPLCFPPIFWDGGAPFVRPAALPPSRSLASRPLSLPLVRSFLPSPMPHSAFSGEARDIGIRFLGTFAGVSAQ